MWLVIFYRCNATSNVLGELFRESHTETYTRKKFIVWAFGYFYASDVFS